MISKLYKTIVFYIIILLSIGKFLYADDSKTTLLFGVVEDDAGVYYSFASSACALFNQYTKNNATCQIKKIDNYDDTLDIISSGQVSFSILKPLSIERLPSDIKNLVWANVSIVARLFKEDYTLLSNAHDLDIASVHSLVSHKMNIGNNSSYLRYAVKSVLDAAGIELMQLKYAPILTSKQQGDAICNGQIDAALYVMATPSSLVYQAANSCELNFVPITGDPAKKLLNIDFLEKSIIKAGTYPGQHDDIETIAERALLVASKNVSNDIMIEMFEIIKNNIAQIKSNNPAFDSLDESMLPVVNQSLSTSTKSANSQ